MAAKKPVIAGVGRPQGFIDDAVKAGVSFAVKNFKRTQNKKAFIKGVKKNMAGRTVISSRGPTMVRKPRKAPDINVNDVYGKMTKITPDMYKKYSKAKLQVKMKKRYF